LTVDHLVYGAPDVGRAADDLERLLGVRASPGGRHTGRGTHNALIALGSERYLEIIGPDPGQAGFRGVLPFGLDDVRTGKLITWAAKAPDIERRVSEARRLGYDPGDLMPRSRERPDGSVLRWRLTSLGDRHPDWLVPFLIDWGSSPHPSATAPSGVRLRRLRAVHPDPDELRRVLVALGLASDVMIEQARTPRLIADLDSPNGPVELA
jgi:hypothetical protein